MHETIFLIEIEKLLLRLKEQFIYLKKLILFQQFFVLNKLLLQIQVIEIIFHHYFALFYSRYKAV